jgi:hypothetical protein
MSPIFWKFYCFDPNDQDLIIYEQAIGLTTMKNLPLTELMTVEDFVDKTRGIKNYKGQVT